MNGDSTYFRERIFIYIYKQIKSVNLESCKCYKYIFSSLFNFHIFYINICQNLISKSQFKSVDRKSMFVLFTYLFTIFHDI